MSVAVYNWNGFYYMLNDVAWAAVSQLLSPGKMPPLFLSFCKQLSSALKISSLTTGIVF